MSVMWATSWGHVCGDILDSGVLARPKPPGRYAPGGVQGGSHATADAPARRLPVGVGSSGGTGAHSSP
jgi:hypothetical protein